MDIRSNVSKTVEPSKDKHIGFPGRSGNVDLHRIRDERSLPSTMGTVVFHVQAKIEPCYRV